MFTRLGIQNFKAWKDTGELRLAPLTVFFGTNSSGKTSLLQFLLMLKQTAQSTDRKRVLHFGDRYSLVDLGVFPEMIFRHEASLDLAFEVEWESNMEEGWVRNAKTGEKVRLERIAFKAAIERESEASDRVVVKHFQYRLINSLFPLSIGMSRQANGDGYELAHDNFNLKPKSRRHGVLPAPVHFYGFPDVVDARFQSAGPLDDLVYAFEQRLDQIHHLGPLREPPARTYSWSGEAPEHVGHSGEFAVGALLAAQGRMITVGEDHSGHPFMRLIAEWLVKLGLLESFEVRPIAPNRRDYEVWVRTPASPESVNLADVGFGLSQVLPVLVQCFYPERDSTVLFEQPELHLHPRAQTGLADLFIQAINAQEGGVPRNAQFIVESHSEHFLRRLQRRIAEGKLSPEQTALYFCEPGSEGSSIKALKLDEYGNITNWPEKFFGDEMGELTAMTEAAMERRLAQGKR
jgi:predicted ATPase